mmetsp:Transcript_21872/g.37703  ORF Transcript_21872/g.37703 Transcript_21872/m.37703 type:complete len:735 (+) Transcript_21872:99-2303(+)
MGSNGAMLSGLNEGMEYQHPEADHEVVRKAIIDEVEGLVSQHHHQHQHQHHPSDDQFVVQMTERASVDVHPVHSHQHPHQHQHQHHEPPTPSQLIDVVASNVAMPDVDAIGIVVTNNAGKSSKKSKRAKYSAVVDVNDHEVANTAAATEVQHHDGGMVLDASTMHYGQPETDLSHADPLQHQHQHHTVDDPAKLLQLETGYHEVASSRKSQRGSKRKRAALEAAQAQAQAEAEAQARQQQEEEEEEHGHIAADDDMKNREELDVQHQHGILVADAEVEVEVEAEAEAVTVAATVDADEEVDADADADTDAQPTDNAARGHQVDCMVEITDQATKDMLRHNGHKASSNIAPIAPPLVTIRDVESHQSAVNEHHRNMQALADTGTMDDAMTLKAIEDASSLAPVVPRDPKVYRSNNEVYNSRGFRVCGVRNHRGSLCSRIGHCPFHAHLKSEMMDDDMDQAGGRAGGSADPVKGGTSSGKYNSGDENEQPAGSDGEIGERRGVKRASASLVNVVDVEAPPERIRYKQSWTTEEHARFLEGLEKYGKGKWKQISKYVGTRNAYQCQSHAQKHFIRQNQLQDRRKRRKVTNVLGSRAPGPDGGADDFQTLGVHDMKGHTKIGMENGLVLPMPLFMNLAAAANSAPISATAALGVHPPIPKLRVTIYRNGESKNGKALIVPATWEEFLNLCAIKLETGPLHRAYSRSGGEIVSLDELCQDDTVYLCEQNDEFVFPSVDD